MGIRPGLALLLRHLRDGAGNRLVLADLRAGTIAQRANERPASAPRPVLGAPGAGLPADSGSATESAGPEPGASARTVGCLCFTRGEHRSVVGPWRCLSG